MISPVHVPGPEGATAIAREPLWFAYATGTDRPTPPPWTWDAEPPPDTHVAPLPVSPPGASRSTLPLGTVDRLAEAAYPAGRATGPDTIGHAMVAAFGAARREPENPYNDHRPYASARCLFPVEAVLDGGGRARLLDPARHALVDLGATGATPSGHRELALAGRYGAVPRGYRWFRGSLVTLELGFALRSLAVACELFGVPARLRLPDAGSRARLAALHLAPGTGWSLPLVVDFPEGRAGPRGVIADIPPDPPVTGDPVLADVVAANRAQSFDPTPAWLGAAVPAGLDGATAASWADVLGRRHSGRMPRGLHGMSGRRERLHAHALTSAARWAAVAPPGPQLREAFAHVRATVAVQDIDGSTTGVHRARDGAAYLVGADPTIMERLDAAYGYGLTPGNGCDVRHASMVWFLSVHPRQLVERHGTGAWTAAQYACGWVAHGLCLAAAAAGLFARPVRAFQEALTHDLLDLDPDETTVLAVVVGTPRHHVGTVLDIRL